MIPKPKWLKKRAILGSEYNGMNTLLSSQKINTICQEAMCPNMMECFSKGTATFLILGNRCTRDCSFCSVDHGPICTPDGSEPDRVASTALSMRLKYVVITSVTRDDLPDGGAKIFAETIKAIRKNIQDVCIEVLIPDFNGSERSLDIVIQERPNVLSHNIETVPRLYPVVRPQADYLQSLKLLFRSTVSGFSLLTKSGLMLGLGESDEEIEKTLDDLLDVGCRILTLGQYLQPTQDQVPVVNYVSPEKFLYWKEKATLMGFDAVASGTFVRSSYKAKEIYHSIKLKLSGDVHE